MNPRTESVRGELPKQPIPVHLPDELPLVDDDLGNEPTLETPAPDSADGFSFAKLVKGAKDRYAAFKTSLLERTDATLERVADSYVEKYEAARDPRTGEVPQTYFSRINRAVESVRESITLQAAIDLGCRAALRPLEFSAGMAARYTFVDFAVKAVEYAELEKTYNAQGGVKAIENQAMQFAAQVKEHFEALGTMVDQELPGEKTEDRETFRQKKIEDGVEQARQLLNGTHIAPDAQEKILADLRNYLDTTVYDPSRSSLLRRWDRLGRGYAPAIRDLVTKHIDIYQKRQARNVSAVRSVAMLTTFGLESYIVSRALSAKTALTTNYDKELTQLPAEQRTGMERMRAFGRAVKEGMAQLVMTDTFRSVRAESSQVDALVDELITDEQEYALSKDFDVDGIANRLQERFATQLKAKGLDQAWLYDQIETIADRELIDRRRELKHLLKTRLLDMHRRQVKSVARQAEHLYDQYNVNITALSILGNVDMAVNEVARVRDGIGIILEHASGGRIDPTVATADQDIFEKLPTEPQVALVTHAAETIFQAVQGARADVQAASVAIQEPAGVTPEENITFEPEAEIEAEALIMAPEAHIRNHTIQSGDTLWSLATSHLEEYRSLKEDGKLQIPDVIKLIQQDNSMGESTNIVVGHPLQLAEFVTASDVIEMGENDGSEPLHLSAQQVIELKAAARNMDAHEGERENFLPEINRSQLDNLAAGTYHVVLGERLGLRNGSMPVHYSEAVTVIVSSEGVADVYPGGGLQAEPVPLETFLAEHKQPIVRVFQTEGESLQEVSQQLDPEKWSQRSLALVRYLQEHPESNVKAGEYCSKYVAGELGLFSRGLSEELGISLLDGEGKATGVSVHAPMWSAGLESMGGRTIMDLDEYFDSGSDSRPLERLDNASPEYKDEVQKWIEASTVPLRQATLQYDGTHIRDLIAVNEEVGGEANSHVVMLLGETELSGTPKNTMTLERYLWLSHGVSPSDVQERGWMFETLGIEVNGSRVTNEADWQTMRLQAGDEVVVRDVAINHRYGGDVADSLVTMMVRKGSFTPVSITEPNAAVVNEALTYHGAGGDFAIETFHRVQSGDTMAVILHEQGVPRNLWMASVYAMRADGINPDRLLPGQLVPVYEAGTLQNNIDTIYSTEEARLAQMENSPHIHIVRPGETMDELTASFFQRERYSTTEWSQLRGRMAEVVPDVNVRQVEMSGDEYTPPYSVTEYQLRADSIVRLTAEDLAEFDREIVEQRLSERVYLPDTMPIRTVDGVIEEKLPGEIGWLINDSIDRHPEYTESERAALALVYANEGMRETADKNIVSDAIEWVNEYGVKPTEGLVVRLGLGEVGDATLSQTMRDIIETSEYLTSRQMLKDVAWWIHDTPAAAAALDEALYYAKLDISHNRVTDVMHQVGLDVDTIELYKTVAPGIDAVQDKIAAGLEKVQGISSAGIFQVRANNFVAEGDASRNTTEEVFGRRMSYDELEAELRANPLLNVDATAHILHENAIVIDTYLQASDDPLRDDETARVLAIANSYNGGPYKTLVGGLQVGIRDMANTLEVNNLSLDKASGRDTDSTQDAFVQVCLRLAEEGKIQRTEDEIIADASLLGNNTIAFLRSETMQQFKTAYAVQRGEEFSVLPNMNRLDDADITYGNYAYLANAGGALDQINSHSTATRTALGHEPAEVIAREYVGHEFKMDNAG